ncbi:hypothetical protein FHQ30_06470, partial [Pasteurellaceae bacterium Phil11]
MSINKININNFGSFQQFEWDNTVRDKGSNKVVFKRLNIIYGRNYSGKTTLSRIFRTLQTRRTPDNYFNVDFSVFNENVEIKHPNLESCTCEIRVYNQDFVKDNLSFLTNQANGEIKTFAIMGEKNNEIEIQIENIENQLGDLEQQSGLRFQLAEQQKLWDSAVSEHRTAETNLNEELKNHARTIKENPAYQEVNYNIARIKQDIGNITTKNISKFSNSEVDSKKVLLKQDALKELHKISINFNLDQLISQTKEILQRQIRPTEAIQELLSNHLLQNWVKQGKDLHKNRKSCAFCQQPLPDNIWQKLDAHFNQESQKLEADIDSGITFVEKEISKISGLAKLSRQDFYVDYQEKFESINSELDNNLKSYSNHLGVLKNALLERKKDIFTPSEIPELKNNITELNRLIEEFCLLIKSNNERSKTLEDDKMNARKDLRLSDVVGFIDSIKYDDKKNSIASLDNKVKEESEKVQKIQKEVSDLEREIQKLRSELTDERKGAERINKLLNHFFGHDGITLEAKDDLSNQGVKFQIMRGNNTAYNLSEGECSLVAFCYFMAKLEEINSKGKELIIYIDDPISSLDSNHIFFVYSLIESLITKPGKYKQLFISTHNLDFLKYLKRITIPKKEVVGTDGQPILDTKGKPKKESDCQHFIIERIGEKSQISLMPNYLKQYVTEYNYLFHKIYNCGKTECTDENYEQFY